MKDFEKEQEPTLKYKSGKTSMATTAVLENWKSTKATCPECGGKHVAINTMCVLTSYPEQYQYICSDCGHRWTDYKAQLLGPIQSWPSLEYEDVTPVGQMGWICPKCGGVFAPHMNYCTNCTQPKVPNIVYSVQPTTSGDDWYRENFVSTVENKRADYSAWQEKELKKENNNGNKSSI